MKKNIRASFLAGSCMLSAVFATAAWANTQETRTFQIPRENLKSALGHFAQQTGTQIIFKDSEVSATMSSGVSGVMSNDVALQQLLRGTGFAVSRDESGAIAIVRQTPARPARQSVSLTQPVEAPSAEAPSDIGIQEIVVTAQKRAESAQKVPIAISVIGGKSLSERNIVSQEGLSSITSGLEIHHSSTGAQPFVRSIGNNTAAPGNEPPVATYVDGVYRPSPSGSLFSLNGIERIEVLKGPQGTLFGRNSAGGVINIVTRAPQATPSVDLKVGYANYNTVSGSFYGTTGIADNLAMDLSVSGYKQHDGWGKNLTDGTDTYLSYNINARSKIRWTPTERTTITLAADYDKTRGDGGMTLAGMPGTLSDSTVKTGGYFDTDSNIKQYLINEQWGGDLHIEQDLDWATLTSITSGRGLKSRAQEDTDLGPKDVSYFTFDVREKTYTQEVNLQAEPSSALKWIVGTFYYNDKAEYSPFGNLGAGGNGSLLYAAQKSDSIAGYAQATSPLWTDAAHITLGIRYTHDNRKVARADKYIVSHDIQGVPVLTPSPLVFSGPKSITQEAVTYKVALDYQFTDSVLGYVSYNRGFKSGNYNMTNPVEAPLKPTFIDAYEIGTKTRLFDNRVQLNLAGFFYKMFDVQVRSVDPVTSLPVNNNAATARYLGLEGDLVAKLTNGLQLTANATYVSSKYLSFPSTSFITINPNGTIGGKYTDNATGKEVLYTEPLSASIGLRYEMPVMDGTLVSNANVSYHARSWYDQQNIIRRPARTMVDAGLSWTSGDEKWGVDIWGQNLLDKHYPAAVFLFSGVGAAYSASTPRTFGISFRYHY